MSPFTDLEDARLVSLKNSLYEFGIALFVQIFHYFCFTIQLVYATCV